MSAFAYHVKVDGRRQRWAFARLGLALIRAGVWMLGRARVAAYVNGRRIGSQPVKVSLDVTLTSDHAEGARGWET